ncbi:methylthioadenosine phosphorylase [Dehalogenimonas alkenigignens]|uniref:S-methyl-5'-thioadenosine phosphorylase n=1 Tax=Dehalogenimonas alkenigignens TaxID=1217799 RepID=A0A0W0GFW8_9CHLR|nr:S-methyl-5'-thioadenosine phosphorylase [Dehalogenimonas alkenigignens]KTB47444.1 methylthioadenosine phosphorylase [Dehalogenimonas alkenigignens]
MTDAVKLAVIGGTGLYDIEGLTAKEELDIDTPYGRPSDVIVTGELSGVRVAFLPRHGRGHRIMPTDIPVRANIWALKSLGVEHIIAINSVGSFKKDIAPGHLLIPDQLIDRTSRRVNSFFGDGVVAHIGFAEPFCPNMRQILTGCAREAGAAVHDGGTYVVMEGPAFSTRAESRLHQSWGADVIGMTALPEAKLAREAEICYGIIACSTDYDSWHEEETPVSVDMIISTLKANMEVSKRIIKLAAARLPPSRRCACPDALKNAIVTDPAAIAPDRKEHLKLIIGKYIR